MPDNVNPQITASSQSAWKPVVPKPPEERREYPIHVEQFEVNVAQPGMPEFAVPAGEARHQSSPADSADTAAP